LANALMKAETKSKRRVTLSICGLGFLDETEADSIPGAVVHNGNGEKPPGPPASEAAREKVDLSKRKRVEFESYISLASGKDALVNLGKRIDDGLKKQLLPGDLEGLRAFYKAALDKFKVQAGHLGNGTPQDGDAKE
jgi:hypothetical protein